MAGGVPFPSVNDSQGMDRRKPSLSRAEHSYPTGGLRERESIAQTAPAQTDSKNDSLIRASVRLKIEDQTGNSVGSGTIIDARSGEALIIITCGHVFRDAVKNGTDSRRSVRTECAATSPSQTNRLRSEIRSRFDQHRDQLSGRRGKNRASRFRAASRRSRRQRRLRQRRGGDRQIHPSDLDQSLCQRTQRRSRFPTGARPKRRRAFHARWPGCWRLLRG